METNNKDLQDKLMRLQDDKVQEFQAAQQQFQDYEVQIEETNLANEKRITQMSREHVQRIEELKAEHAKQMKELTSLYEHKMHVTKQQCELMYSTYIPKSNDVID